MITRNQAKRIGKLRTRKRREEEAFLVEGVRLVEELFASSLDVELVIVAPSLPRAERGERLLQTIRDREMKTVEVADRELAELADTETPQGVLAIVREPLWELAKHEPPGRASVLVFDRLADPGNMGTLVRTARALGVSWCIALPGSVDPWSPKTVRASAGSSFHLPLSREPWSEVASWLRKHDFAIFCADPGGEPVARNDLPSERFALVLGSEASGIADDVSQDCGIRVAVRLSVDMDSLNVATAGALLLDRLLG